MRGSVDIPHSQSCLLNHIEDGTYANKDDNAIPKVSRISITYDLELGIVKDLAEEIFRLGRV